MILRQYLSRVLCILTLVLREYGYSEPVPLVRPSDDHLKLQIEKQGLDLLKNLPEGPLAAVVVIGPYRSGKSFLLNQLLEVECDMGFGVGHGRETFTKGIWIWRQPRSVLVGGQVRNLLFIDTEGFESLGRADAYDDRVFSLSMIMASLLIYNLPESVRESDIEKLSFAAELAEQLFLERNSSSVDKYFSRFHQPKLLWLIQRDFLLGEPVESTVSQALQIKENPSNDERISRLNQVRASLSHLAEKDYDQKAVVHAFGLPQPHLNRTELCNIPDSQFNPDYLQKRERLKLMVNELAVPKGMDGSAMAELIVRSVDALNSREIPTASSIIVAFNAEVARRCILFYEDLIDPIELPINETSLETMHQAAKERALDKYLAERFGVMLESDRNEPSSNDTSFLELLEGIKKAFVHKMAVNEYVSSKECERVVGECLDNIDKAIQAKLPSKKKLENSIKSCKMQQEHNCVGPSSVDHTNRLSKEMARNTEMFLKDYNRRLYDGILVLSVIVAVAGRFLFQITIMEFAGWIGFAALNLYPNFMMTGEKGLYDTVFWQRVSFLWEALVYNKLLDMETHGPYLLVTFLTFIVLVHIYGRLFYRRSSRKRGQELPMSTATGHIKSSLCFDLLFCFIPRCCRRNQQIPVRQIRSSRRRKKPSYSSTKT